MSQSLTESLHTTPMNSIYKSIQSRSNWFKVFVERFLGQDQSWNLLSGGLLLKYCLSVLCYQSWPAGPKKGGLLLRRSSFSLLPWLDNTSINHPSGRWLGAVLYLAFVAAESVATLGPLGQSALVAAGLPLSGTLLNRRTDGQTESALSCLLLIGSRLLQVTRCRI